MQSPFRECFKEPRIASIAADGCEIIQRAFIAASAPACPWLCSKADTDLGDYCTDGDLQTNEIVSGAAPLVQAWLLQASARAAALADSSCPRLRLQPVPAIPTPPVPGVSPSRIPPALLLG